MEFFIGFGFGFSLCTLLLYKIGNNKTPFSVVMDSIVPKEKHRAYVPKREE